MCMCVPILHVYKSTCTYNVCIWTQYFSIVVSLQILTHGMHPHNEVERELQMVSDERVPAMYMYMYMCMYLTSNVILCVYSRIFWSCLLL